MRKMSAKLCQTYFVFSKYILLNNPTVGTFDRKTFHNTSRPLPTIEVAFFTSLSSFIEEPNTAQCLHGSVREA
jgi:hypothetical protein